MTEVTVDEMYVVLALLRHTGILQTWATHTTARTACFYTFFSHILPLERLEIIFRFFNHIYNITVNKYQSCPTFQNVSNSSAPEQNIPDSTPPKSEHYYR